MLEHGWRTGCELRAEPSSEDEVPGDLVEGMLETQLGTRKTLGSF